MPVNPASTTGSKPRSLAYCLESRCLLDAFGATVEALLILHEQQFAAILSEDSQCDRFDLLIHMANEKKQQAKYAYLLHVEKHGCSRGFDDLPLVDVRES